MTYVKYNLNPTEKKTGDCVVRAIAKATKKTWHETYDALCAIGRETYAMPNCKETYAKYLKDSGWTKMPMPRFPDNTRYTVGEFAKEQDKGTFILGIANHVTVLIDGDLYDIWDCSHKSVGNYWTKI